MYAIHSVLLLLSTLTTSVYCDGNVIDIKKQLKLGVLSSEKFHAYNTAHLLFNNGNGVEQKDMDDLKVTTFHALGYTGKITIGNPGQTLNVIFETAISDVMLITSRVCKFPKNIFSYFCWSHKGYNDVRTIKGADSPHWEGKSPSFQLYHKKSETDGHLVFDQIKIGQLTISDTVIGVIDSWKSNYPYGKTDGVVGAGRIPDSNFIYGDGRVKSDSTTDLETIKSYPVWSQLLTKGGASKIGFHLYKDKKGRNIGQMILGAEEESKRYKGELQWVPEPPDFRSIYYRLTVTEMKIIGMADGAVEVIQPVSSEFLAQPDPGTSLIAGPADTISKINEMLFKGIEFAKKSSKYGTVEFDCWYRDQLPVVVFVINNRGYTLEPKDYVVKLKDTCASGFMGLSKLPYMNLGDTFLQKHYIVFDILNKQIGLAESVSPQKV